MTPPAPYAVTPSRMVIVFFTVNPGITVSAQHLAEILQLTVQETNQNLRKLVDCHFLDREVRYQRGVPNRMTYYCAGDYLHALIGQAHAQAKAFGNKEL